MSEGGSDQSRRAIGGEFELAVLSSEPFAGKFRKRSPRGGCWTISGRAAFAVILRKLMERGVSHLHLPSYLCESLLVPVKALGLEFSFYPVDLSLAAHPEPPAGAAVLLIHYFGWINPSAERLRKEAAGSYHLIEDFSQSLLTGEGDYAAAQSLAFFSARKFGPVPLGGWSSESAGLRQSDAGVGKALERSLSARRLKGSYLAQREGRVDPSIEARYLSELEYVEGFLERDLEHELPPAVIEIMGGIDWEEVSSRRRSNWLYLKESLPDHLPPLEQELSSDTVPLGCVILSKERDSMRRRLFDERVYCPVHWRLPEEVPRARFPEAHFLSESCLTVPIDQRYDRNDLVRVVDLLKG